MQPSEHFALGSGVTGMVAGARYNVISNIGNTIAIVTFGSVGAIGVCEGSSGPRPAQPRPWTTDRPTS
jgi:hypothetical protein